MQSHKGRDVTSAADSATLSEMHPLTFALQILDSRSFMERL
ncbi:hypothetical protein RSSM_02546 [Rhodopirellula sallentina SM41]|uniref:Uncharacterized protein n=1 Tax=Rhodopirellula sallentina SM41 TaxID=1263870 RepID=M5U408_9BACT|nr:hypothetical protein RSSM_02546 [Rhodopirellula sallentina SM41]